MMSRRHALALAGGLMTLAGGVSLAQPVQGSTAMQIRRAGSQPSAKGPADWFTGTVRVDPMFPARPTSPI